MEGENLADTGEERQWEIGNLPDDRASLDSKKEYIWGQFFNVVLLGQMFILSFFLFILLRILFYHINESGEILENSNNSSGCLCLFLILLGPNFWCIVCVCEHFWCAYVCTWGLIL